MSDRLNAKPREVTVVYCDSDKAPCACFADGVAIATVASVGQRTLQIRRRRILPALWQRSSFAIRNRQKRSNTPLATAGFRSSPNGTKRLTRAGATRL